MIVALEGPSAVGKSSTAAALARSERAAVVPEVTELFERPADEPPEWYLERQLDRWRLAVEHASGCPLVVLDGDPFQPLWYNWAYGFRERQGLDFMQAFYRPHLESGALRFPDRYAILGAPVESLRERKESDRSRRRRGFERHLRFVAPQRRYFAAMQARAQGLVHFVEPGTIEETARAVAELSRSPAAPADAVELFDRTIRWLRANRAGEGETSAGETG